MKYLVNRETKEHRLYTEGDYNRLGHTHGKWDVVEADDEGWIPWEGGDCPLPGGFGCEIQTKEGDRLLSREAKRWTWSPNIGDATITHYRPILAEKEEPRRHGRTIVHIPESQQSVFDRLKSAIAASESIPDIIAEIDALLPEEYCVAKREEQPAEDMSDWRNWREGDVLVIVSNECGHGFGIGSLVKVEEKTYDNSCCRCTSSYESWYVAPQEARFHARPAR